MTWQMYPVPWTGAISREKYSSKRELFTKGGHCRLSWRWGPLPCCQCWRQLRVQVAVVVPLHGSVLSGAAKGYKGIWVFPFRGTLELKQPKMAAMVGFRDVEKWLAQAGKLPAKEAACKVLAAKAKQVAFT